MPLPEIRKYEGSWLEVINRAWMTGCIIWYLLQPHSAPFIRTALIGAGLLIGGSLTLMVITLAVDAARFLIAARASR
jgi:hypothetical protein